MLLGKSELDDAGTDIVGNGTLLGESLAGGGTVWPLSGEGTVEGGVLSEDGDIGDGDDDGSLSGEGVPLGVVDAEEAGAGVGDVG
jgi:hypothetical protein